MKLKALLLASAFVAGPAFAGFAGPPVKDYPFQLTIKVLSDPHTITSEEYITSYATLKDCLNAGDLFVEAGPNCNVAFPGVQCLGADQTAITSCGRGD